LSSVEELRDRVIREFKVKEEFGEIKKKEERVQERLISEQKELILLRNENINKKKKELENTKSELYKEMNKSSEELRPFLENTLATILNPKISESEKNTNKQLLKKYLLESEIEKACSLQKSVYQLEEEIELMEDNLKENLKSKEQEITNSINDYLNSKQTFINLRKETITLLQEVVNIMENKTVLGSGKYVRLEKGSKLVVSAIKASPIPVPYVKEIIAETIPLIINNFKSEFNKENVELFREHLTKSDNIPELVQQRKSLLEIINKNPQFSSSQSVIELFNLNDEERIFNKEYEIYKVATNI
jgi:hypothetical protein